MILMNKELKITKEDLIVWLDRPPTDYDLELCAYLENALENQEKYYNQIQKLQEKFKATNKGLIKVLSKRLKWKRRYYKEKYIRKELKKWLEKQRYDIDKQDVLDKIKELEERNNDYE